MQSAHLHMYTPRFLLALDQNRELSEPLLITLSVTIKLTFFFVFFLIFGVAETVTKLTMRLFLRLEDEKILNKIVKLILHRYLE